MKNIKVTLRPEMKKIKNDYKLTFSGYKLLLIVLLSIIILATIPIHYYFSEYRLYVYNWLAFYAGMILALLLLLPVIERIFIPLFLLIIDFAYKFIDKANKKNND